MAYVKKIWRLKHGTIVKEYHTGRYGAPGQKRQKKVNPTPEQVRDHNQRIREEKAKMYLMEYFDVNDYYSTWTYRKEERPLSMEAAKAQFAKAKEYIRKEYRKRGHELRWIRNIEVGTRNGWHIHVVLNRIPDTDLILKEAWQYGKVINELTYESRGMQELASYLTKTQHTDKRLRESNFSHSRNMPLPEPETRVYLHWKTWNHEKVTRIPKGFYLDQDSLHEGENPVTGYPYRKYTLLPIERRNRHGTG